MSAPGTHLIHVHGLDRAARADRHEGGRADRAARHGDLAAPGLAVGAKQLEAELRRSWSWTPVAKQQAGIAIGIEAIAGGDRMAVGGLHDVEAGKAATSMNSVERGRWKLVIRIYVLSPDRRRGPVVHVVLVAYDDKLRNDQIREAFPQPSKGTVLRRVIHHVIVIALLPGARERERGSTPGSRSQIRRQTSPEPHTSM